MLVIYIVKRIQPCLLDFVVFSKSESFKGNFVLRSTKKEKLFDLFLYSTLNVKLSGVYAVFIDSKKR